MSHWENKNLNAQNTQYSMHTKHWMSQRLQKHEEFTVKEERKLFRTSFLTARKWCVSTQSESELETSTKKPTKRFGKEFLFDKSTESSNMTTMNLFQQKQDESSRSQESLRSQEFQKDSRQKSSSFKMIS